MVCGRLAHTRGRQTSLMAQRMSVAAGAGLHMAAAWEVARELSVSLAGAEDEAALFGGGVADSVA